MQTNRIFKNATLFWAIIFILQVFSIKAEELNINISTPAIERLKLAMNERGAGISKYKNAGALGENHDGFLEARSLDNSGLGLADKKQVKELLNAENSDRRNLYREILIATKQSPDDEAQVRLVCTLAAAERRNKALLGEWIQTPDGVWLKKK